MSQRSGIPMSTLSKVEHDRLTLTYDRLQQLSHRLNIKMSDLFAEAGETAVVPGYGRRSIGTIENAIRVNTANYDYYYLCTELRQKRMIPNLSRIRAKSLAEFGALVSHAGEEFVYVVEGQLVVHTECYEPVILEQGETIYIDSMMGHAYLAGDGSQEALILAVMSSAEDDLMGSLITLHSEREASA